MYVNNFPDAEDADPKMRQAKSWVDFLSPMIIEGLATGRFPKLSVTKMVEVSTPL